ncbi:5'/3'-nucleotidase SurE [Breznakiella homolactica]|uniref:5'-nucleotidase SurE n=1 Tax=Breznakiella homolactica TaxID=2798577 RepID=A0A7T7XKQ9_9SPIR|nr:5'/3'-nucleotidase SurE [Breznakiella homolactica]QQO08002.1 5'/3'-nucleotidase SurE [Breznakiella homolactica]
MKIVLTNDDGIDCAGLIKLAEALEARGGHEIYICAPESNRSGVSHSLSLRGPVRIDRRSSSVWTCSGTPADCVMVATLGGLPFVPDLIVSGINAGPNVGTDIIYSGTAAAARQAALHDIPGIALSLCAGGDFHWDMAAEFCAGHLDDFFDLWVEDTFINVNIPNSPSGPLGIEVTYPSRRRYNDTLAVFNAPDKKAYYFVETGTIDTEPEEGSDWDAVKRNMASVSPVFIHPVVRRDICGGVPDHSSAAPRPGTARLMQR